MHSFIIAYIILLLIIATVHGLYTNNVLQKNNWYRIYFVYVRIRNIQFIFPSENKGNAFVGSHCLKVLKHYRLRL